MNAISISRRMEYGAAPAWAQDQKSASRVAESRAVESDKLSALCLHAKKETRGENVCGCVLAGAAFAAVGYGVALTFKLGLHWPAIEAALNRLIQ